MEIDITDKVTSKEILEETLINLERLESELRRVKRRLQEHIEAIEDATDDPISGHAR